MYCRVKNTELLNLLFDYLIKFFQINYSPLLKFGPVKTNMRVCSFAPHNILIIIRNIFFSEVINFPIQRADLGLLQHPRWSALW